MIDIQHLRSLLAAAKLGRIEGKTFWEFAQSWYEATSIHRSITVMASKFGTDRECPRDTHSMEFAEWLALQSQLAMAKGMELVRSSYAEVLQNIPDLLDEFSAATDERDKLTAYIADISLALGQPEPCVLPTAVRELRADRDRLAAYIANAEGGEPLSLLRELDAAREQIDRLRTEREEIAQEVIGLHDLAIQFNRAAISGGWKMLDGKLLADLGSLWRKLRKEKR